MLRLEQKWDRRVEGWHSHVTSAAAFEQVLGAGRVFVSKDGFNAVKSAGA